MLLMSELTTKMIHCETWKGSRHSESTESEKTREIWKIIMYFDVFFVSSTDSKMYFWGCLKSCPLVCFLKRRKNFKWLFCSFGPSLFFAFLGSLFHCLWFWGSINVTNFKVRLSESNTKCPGVYVLYEKLFPAYKLLLKGMNLN